MQGHSLRTAGLALLLFTAVLLPLVPVVSADSDIGLELSSVHAVVMPGQAVNVTLTLTNDDQWATHEYNLTLNTSTLSGDWDVTLADTALGPVYPTLSDTTTIVVDLDVAAPVGANGQAVITVTRVDDANISNSVTLFLSVAPRYLPELDVGAVGDRGLVAVGPNETVEVDVPVRNSGNVNDTFLLQVDEALDLTDFWAAWNSTQNSSNGTGGNGSDGTGNQSCGNCSGGGNGTGNQSCGNCSGGGNGTSMRGPMGGRALPTDWEVRWLDPVVTDIAPGEIRNHTLRITLPADATPEYRGIALFAGSVGGNHSIQTVIVIEVTTVSDVSAQLVHDANRTFLPGVTEGVEVLVTNNGNDATTLVYSVTSDSGCAAALAAAVGSELQPLASETISLNITPDASEHWNGTCLVTLTSEEANTGVEHLVGFTFVFGVDWGWELTAPAGATSVTPGGTTTLQVGVRNVGTELDEVRFEFSGPAGVSATGPPGWMSVDRGLSAVISVQVSVDSEAMLVGEHNLSVTCYGKHGGEQALLSVTLDIEPKRELSVDGPQGGIVQVTAGDETDFTLMLTNRGTRNLTVNLYWSGLPSSLTISNESALPALVNVSESLSVPLELSASVSASAGTYTAEFTLSDAADGSTLATISLQVEVQHAPAVRLLAAGDTFAVGSHGSSSMDFVVVNDGNELDSFSFGLSPSSDGFEVQIEPLLLELGAGEQGTVSLTMRRTTATGDTALSLVANSSNDNSVSASYDFTVVEVEVGLAVGLTTSISTAQVGEAVPATMWLTNTGNSNMTVSLSVSGIDCPNMPATKELAPSANAVPVQLSCNVRANTPAGVTNFSVSATSLHDNTLSESDWVNITIPADRVNGQPRLFVNVSGTADNTLPWGGSLGLTIQLTNAGNELLSGTLSLQGEGAGDFSPSWTAAGGSNNPAYVIGPGQEIAYTLMLTSMMTESGGDLELRVQAAGAGHSVRSDAFNVKSQSEPMPPAGIDLVLFTLDNQMSVTLLATGWLLLFLVVAIWRVSRRKDEPDIPPLDSLPLGDDLPLPPPVSAEPVEPDIPAPVTAADSDEAEMVDGKVTCPNCAATLKMPASKEPPFRFKCPKCSEKVRVV